MAVMDQKDTYTVGWFLSLVLFGLASGAQYVVYSGRRPPDTSYSALLGSTVDTCYCQSTGFWGVSVFSTKLGPQWYMPCVSHGVCLLVTMHVALCSSRGCQAHGRYEPDGQVRGEIQADMPVVLNTGACGSDCRKTLDFPQFQFVKVVDFSFVLQRLLFMVLATKEIPQLRVDKVVDAPFMQVVQIIPVVVQRQIPMVLTVQQTVETPQLLFRTSLS